MALVASWVSTVANSGGEVGQGHRRLKGRWRRGERGKVQSHPSLSCNNLALHVTSLFFFVGGKEIAGEGGANI